MGSEGGSIVRKPRFLCLHGFRTSGEIMKIQLHKWPKSVIDRLDLVFLDAPFPCQGKSDVEGIFDPPYYEWFQFNKVLWFFSTFFHFIYSLDSSLFTLEFSNSGIHRVYEFRELFGVFRGSYDQAWSLWWSHWLFPGNNLYISIFINSVWFLHSLSNSKFDFCRVQFCLGVYQDCKLRYVINHIYI